MDEILELFKKHVPEIAYEYLKPGVIHYFPNEQEMCQNSEVDAIHLLIEHILKQYAVDRAEIICFGNNLYGKEIENLWKEYPGVVIDLMVCSPTTEIINDHDKKTLNKKISMAVKKENTNVLATESPPTLRSCVLFSEGKPILCCIQNYVISMLDERLPSFKGRQTPCVLLYRYNDYFPMEQYVKFCKSEFKRLEEEEAYIPIINKKTKEIERP